MARALLFGFLIGFPIAASPGPMFFLVLRRTLDRGWRSGLISGGGIATGDAIYAAIAALGMTAIINLLISARRWIGLAGGIAIALIGARTVMSHRAHRTNASNARIARSARLAWAGRPAGEGKVRPGGAGEVGGDLRDYASTLGLTLSNPPTILSFIAVFAGLGVHVGSGWEPAAGLVLGVMLGSALWWLLVTAAISFLRERISARVTNPIGLVSGVALIAFGVLITLQSL